MDKFDFSIVRPNLTILKKVVLGSDYATQLEEVPENLRNSNMLILLTSGGVT